MKVAERSEKAAVISDILFPARRRKSGEVREGRREEARERGGRQRRDAAPSPFN